MILFNFGRVKKHKYPLPVLSIRIDKRFQFIKTHQWCFAYKMFKIGFIEVYYFDTD